ncbi:signal peptidase I [Bacteroides sp. 51]|uniref:signal peptidase I n=1 Tax=Bacteroides sp. 51 TaxID=2302938 RepID=UPI0013D5285F|nr:signal peptidase I [Bacteroides sp. 51]NDV81656.1 signal peptidase I [Bacteroides sp. 51]
MTQLKKILNKLLNLCFYLCLLAVLWGVIQVFCFTSFHVPSDSMKPALLPGDNILVNKMVGGPRLFDIFASLDKKDIDIYRLPGFGSFKRNDVLVFNYPFPGRKDSIGFDVMKYYVKRCIALPGDTLEIRNGYFHIRGVEQELGNREMQEFISNLPDTSDGRTVMRSYPRDKTLGWTIKDFGPFPIPCKGQQVQMNRENWLLYQIAIFWEQKKRPIYKKDGCVYLGDSLLTTYRFEKNYYFMAGDRLKDSEDSRYWGLLPEEFIVGRADFIWLSKKRKNREINWERLMKEIQ